MALGPAVRHAFGPFEPQIANAFRSLFFRVDDLIRLVRRQVPEAKRILEIGAGEGAIAERLVAAYPDASYVGVDISHRVGRLYRGDRSRATFLSIPAEQYVHDHRGAFDLVVICDVLHHVPEGLQDGLLTAARDALRSGGKLVLKEWEDRPNTINAIAHWFETNITRDLVHYRAAADWSAIVSRAFPGASPTVFRLRPWSNNIAMVFPSDAEAHG